MMVSRRIWCKCLCTLIMEFKECDRLNLNISYQEAPQGSILGLILCLGCSCFILFKNRKSPLSLFPTAFSLITSCLLLVGCWTSFSCHWTMSRINVSPENPYGEVTIPRAKIRSPDDNATVIVNPMTMSSNEGNPPPYVVKEAGVEEEEEARSRTCCYRCRRKKWWEDCDWFRSIYFRVC